MILTIYKTSDTARSCIVKLDNSVWGSLSERTLRTLFHLFPGTEEIDSGTAAQIVGELRKAAWQKLLDYLAKAEHSTVESREMLGRHRFHKDIIDDCVKRAVDKRFIDDERYCRLLIESLLQRSKSPQQIKGKLIEKRMPSSLWQPILSELATPESTHSSLEVQVEKVYRSYCKLDKKDCYTKCLTALYRKGFDLDDVRHILDRLIRDK